MLHYHLFSFALVGGGFARVSMGWTDKLINESRLAAARDAAVGHAFSSAVPLAVSYLGEMTPEQAKS